MGIFDALGGGPRRGSGGMSPVMLGLMGLLAYRTLKGKGRLADELPSAIDELTPEGRLPTDAELGGRQQ